MALVIQGISDRNWTCSICHELMDGKNESGSVSIVKRCHHVFHDRCIRQAIEQSNRTCPLCNLPNLRSAEILPNPSYGEECRKWQEDPEHFVLNEDRLKPPEFIGVLREREFNIYEYPERILELNAEAVRIYDTEPHTIENFEKIKKLNQEIRELLQKCCNQALPERLNQINQRIDRLNEDWGLLREDFRVIAEDQDRLLLGFQQLHAQQEVTKKLLDEALEEAGLNSPFHPQKMRANALREEREAALKAEQDRLKKQQDDANHPPQDSYGLQTVAKVVGVFILVFGLTKIISRFLDNRSVKP